MSNQETKMETPIILTPITSANRQNFEAEIPNFDICQAKWYITTNRDWWDSKNTADYMGFVDFVKDRIDIVRIKQCIYLEKIKDHTRSNWDANIHAIFYVSSVDRSLNLKDYLRTNNSKLLDLKG